MKIKILVLFYPNNFLFIFFNTINLGFDDESLPLLISHNILGNIDLDNWSRVELRYKTVVDRALD